MSRINFNYINVSSLKENSIRYLYLLLKNCILKLVRTIEKSSLAYN
jgi:hypothetical protein